MSKQPIPITLQNLPNLAPRPLDAHKGQFGHLLVIGGDYGTAGAPLMAAEMALRTGAGMVSIATRAEHVTAILAHRPELMCLGVASANQLQTLIPKTSVIVAGMGLGQGGWGLSLLSAVNNLDIPQIWDADALNLLAQNKMTAPKQLIITPHVGEAARLLDSTISDIQTDRIKAVLALAKRYQCTAVLKGAGTLVASAQGELAICQHGHPAMAGAGLGDVLAGLIAALIAQHLSSFDAARLAVWLHACAGEILGKQGRGLLATDLYPVIRHLLEEQSPCLS